MKPAPDDLRGRRILINNRFNKSTAFSREERDELGLRGLLPPKIESLEGQVRRSIESVRRNTIDIERYIFLMALMDRNETLFYRLLIDHVEELLPLVYTPTVGQACREFGNIFRVTRGMYFSYEDRGEVAAVLQNWTAPEVRVVVITDGERVLGLGDLGASGMGIPIGKLALYVGLAGIRPEHCLPIMIDVGTNNRELRDDPMYLGLDQERVRGADYEAFMEEVIDAVTTRYPGVLVQFEDFQTPIAYSLLDRYRSRYLCFNDDIQGTAAVALAGVLASIRVTGKRFRDLRILFLGAGSAATGIGDLMVTRYEAAGLSNAEARERLWFVDVNGLVTNSRTDLLPHNIPYAQDQPAMSLVEAIDNFKPDVLIGATGAGRAFDQHVVERMCAQHDRPVIFALSNPTEKSECTAEQCYRWSGGKALFASGSPFEAVRFAGKKFIPGQANNAYIFPGVGLGAVAAEASAIDDEMFVAAAHALADQVSEAELENGSLFPAMSRIRQVSLEIGAAVAECATSNGLAGKRIDGSWREFIEPQQYEPGYEEE